MRLSRPLDDLISPDKAAVLLVLDRAGQPLSGRRIAALTGTVSQPTTSRLLIELTHSGLVSKVPGGYVMNRDHLSYRAIEVLLDSTRELRRRVDSAVAEWATPPVSVVLFGSTARQAEAPTDLDLLVVRPDAVDADDATWAKDVSDLAEHVSRWCGVPCEVLEYSRDELIQLARVGEPLVDSLLRDGVLFAGVDLPTVLRAVAR